MEQPHVLEVSMDDESEIPDLRSRTSKKKDLQRMQALTEQLAAMTPANLDKLGLDPDLKNEVLETKRITATTARKRRLRYLCTLVAEHYDLDSLRKLLGVKAK